MVGMLGLVRASLLLLIAGMGCGFDLEDCVAIALVTPSAASWDDASCATLRQFACECDPLAR